MVAATQNGKALTWFENGEALSKQRKIQEGATPPKRDTSNLEATSPMTQLNILLRRGFIKAGRDTVSKMNQFLPNFISFKRNSNFIL